MKDMFYKSTRGGGYVSGADAIIKGMADDGGLFVPDHIPNISSSIYDMMSMDYREMARFILSMFFTDFTEQEIKDCVYKSYDEKFDDINIAPLKKCGNLFFLELFHGPTLAFKDMALSILPHLLTTALKKQNNKNNVVILTATSGDTGKAALEGFTNIEGIKIIVFYPEIGVSQIQKRQMITHEGSNTYVFGIDGNFDDAQKGVKGIFNDKRFKDILYKNNYIFSSANSINIGRLIPQIVYYFYSYITLCKNKEINMGDKINIAVPTGNFGNILAAYYAKCMGLPVNKLICASNKNNVLWDFFRTGIYDKNRKFVNTISPSMDILISSNLERLLYSISGEDTKIVKSLMESLSEKGSYKITQNMTDNLKDFCGGYAGEAETKEGIKYVYDLYNYIIDPHTAVAFSVYKSYAQIYSDETKTVIASTASPFKFTSSVISSITDKEYNLNDFELIKMLGEYYNGKIPIAVKNIDKRPVIHKTICKKENMKQEIVKVLNI
jgi:threonine synthase